MSYHTQCYPLKRCYYDLSFLYGLAGFVLPYYWSQKLYIDSSFCTFYVQIHTWFVLMKIHLQYHHLDSIKIKGLEHMCRVCILFDRIHLHSYRLKILFWFLFLMLLLHHPDSHILLFFLRHL